jgi:hypothetical protein
LTSEPLPLPKGNAGIEALCRALRSNAFVRELNISHNAVDDRAAVHIAQVRACLMTRAYCAHVDGAPRVNPGLVAHCAIVHSAYPLISSPGPFQMLSINKGLERLVMTHTQITDQGAQVICNCLQV